MTPAVRARDLFLLYRTARGDVPALRGLTLQILPAETVAVLGPSGAGKSSFLSLCAGLRSPSSGELVLLGHPVSSLSAGELTRLRRASVGIVLQHYHRSLPQELSVEEIVALPVRLRGGWGRVERARVGALLKQAGLAGRGDARPWELSGGEQQRVAVCAAVAKKPRLILADEPTGELDARVSMQVVELLLELTEEAGAAALIVTHDPLVAERTERTIHIRDGRLSGEGAVDPTLVIDEQGWLRIPRRLRERAGVRDRLRASASWGRIELRPADPGLQAEAATPKAPAEALEPLSGPGGIQVELRHVTKCFGSPAQVEPVLDDLSWTFGTAALQVISGPSGSGKTTLLNVMAALERPDAGEVNAEGQIVSELSDELAAAWRRGMLGYLSQHSTLVDFLSARENVELALTLRGISGARASAVADQWLDWVGLGALSERRADQLSGGEQRRVALARALAPQPRLLLADEPTAHLDRLSGRLVIRLLQRAAHERSTTVIAASHDRDLVVAADARLDLAARAAGAAPESEEASEPSA
jgi:ABC-type lipoprotein export system ATPase subunit